MSIRYQHPNSNPVTPSAAAGHAPAPARRVDHNYGDLGVSERDMPPEFVISDWQPKDRNTLKAVFTLMLPSGMVIHGCMLHESHGKRWVGLPAQKYTKADGEPGFMRIIEFASWQSSERFKEAALEAIDNYLGGAR